MRKSVNLGCAAWNLHVCVCDRVKAKKLLKVFCGPKFNLQLEAHTAHSSAYC